MKLRNKIIVGLLLVSSVALQYPLGFYVGQTIKDRPMCQHVQEGTNQFRYTMGGIMRGEHTDNKLTAYYDSGKKDGMLFALKNCYDKIN